VSVIIAEKWHVTCITTGKVAKKSQTPYYTKTLVTATTNN